MRTLRLLVLFALTVGLVTLLGDMTAAAQPANKKDKRNKKQHDPVPAVTPAPAVPAKPITGSVGPKDAAALARLIDEHITRKLTEGKVTPSPVCSDAEFLRRTYLDLTGVIPSSDKARAFLDSADPAKRAKLVDELLDSPNFGRHLADIWQPKLMRRDSGNRFVLREPFVKWLEDSFNKNTPWNVFVFNLLTASGTAEENPAVTYFLANRSVDKLTDGVAQHFLGVQLQCAQCHNHPFTEWKQAEYWGMAEFFSKVRAENPKNPNQGGDNSKIGVQEGPIRTKARDFFPESAKTVPAKLLGGPSPNLAPTEPYRPVLARWMTAPDNPYFARAMVNRTWALLFGTGFVNPVDDMHDENTPSHPELLAALARNFADNGFDVKYLYRAVCATQAYQRTSRPVSGNEKDDHLFSHLTVKVLSPHQLYDSLAAVTGLDKAPAEAAGKAGNPKRGPANPRDGFVQFFLAGAEAASPTEYEAGIPQALKLMNSRVTGNPALIRQFAAPGDQPAVVFERIYLTALSRRPTPAEVKRLTEYVSKAGTPAEAYGDILWAVLNSSEFTMVR
ncbi:MAG: hypothetical protein JWO38_4222 [Gemmataceae bacterium]|nr:hypothetical protein [Gemmataceae bacterium]